MTGRGFCMCGAEQPVHLIHRVEPWDCGTCGRRYVPSLYGWQEVRGPLAQRAESTTEGDTK
jgi:hypothetical protein